MIKQSIMIQKLYLKEKNIQKIMKEQLRKNTNAVKWIFPDILLFPALMTKGFCSVNVKYTKLSKQGKKPLLYIAGISVLET